MLLGLKNELRDIGVEMGIREAFNKSAKDYDSERKQLIPCFDPFYRSALEIISFYRETPPQKILDLGAGTGLFSSLVADLFPDAEFVLVDLSEKMLDEAQNRFLDRNVKVDYQVLDYSNEPIEDEFDLVISALSIHHLSHDEKEKLFQKIFACLNANGLFVNADQVLAESLPLDAIYRSMWVKQVKEKGVSQQTLEAAFLRMKEDKMSRLSDQLRWLDNAGFSEVNCWFQDFSFVVYSGHKP